MSSKLGDRGGSREGRKKSLNRVKQAKFKHEQEVTKLQDGRQQATADKLSVSAPAPPLTPHLYDDDWQRASSSSSSSSLPAPAALPPLPAVRYIDCGAHLTSRQFDGSLQSVLRRACAASVVGIVVTCPDMGRADEVLELLRQWPGLLLAALGISPDSVKRQSERVSEGWLERLRCLSLLPAVVCISCGLDLTREVSTHYLQQQLLVAQCQLAARLRLPLVVTEKAAADRVIPAVTAAFAAAARDVETADGCVAGEATPASSQQEMRVALRGFSGPDDQLAAYIDAGWHIMLDGRLCSLQVTDTQQAAAEAGDADGSSSSPLSSRILPELSGEGAPLFRQLRCGLLPLARLLLASDSPLHTPQSLPDAHLRSQRNEPANLPAVFATLSAAYRLPAPLLAQTVEANTRRFFRLQYAAEAAQQGQHGEAKEELKDALTAAATEAELSAGLQATQLTAQEPARAEAVREQQQRDAAGAEDGDEPDSEEETDSQQEEDATAASALPFLAAAGRRRRAVPAAQSEAVSGTPTQSRAGRRQQRARAAVIAGAGAELEPLPGVVRYACRRCRTPLFTQLDLRPHQTAVEQQTAAASLQADAAELTHCGSLFVQPKPQLVAASSSSLVAGLSERLECGACGFKLGRSALQAASLPCSCGRLCSGFPPFLAVNVNRIDTVDSSEQSAALLSAPRAVGAAYQQAQVEAEEESSRGQAARRERERQRRDGRRQRKQQREDQRGNFTEFRNKTLVKHRQKEQQPHSSD